MKPIYEILQKTSEDWQARLPGFGVSSLASVPVVAVGVQAGAGGVAACLQDGAPPALSPSVTRGQQSHGGAR